MKKNILILALGAMSLTCTAACSGSKADSSTTDSTDSTAIESTLAETNAGVDSATYNDDATAVATMDDRRAVIDLTKDDVFRPGKKVDRLTILDFNATWCGPCKQFAPVFHEAAEHFGQTVDFVSIDVDKNPKTADAFGVRAIPTVVFIYPNGKTKTYVGTEDLLPSTRFMALVQGEM